MKKIPFEQHADIYNPDDISMILENAVNEKNITGNNKGKKVTDTDKKINGKTYYFNEDGEMQYGWHEDDGNAYYLGTEDEGWRAESQWLWLEKSGNNENDLDDDEY